jgi:protein-L-isoaspartate O-methyltransferase
MSVESRLASLVVELGADRSLCLPEAWRKRMDALDRLDACLIHGDPETDSAALEHALKMEEDLEAVNEKFYEALRRGIREGGGAELLMRCAYESEQDEKNAGSTVNEHYDDLDVLVSGILQLDDPGEEIAERVPERVFYQPTPARQIFDFIRRAGLDERDTVVDLGAGLGHVSLLTAICSPGRCIGIECEPAYVAIARKSAEDLKLTRATFFEQDVRHADLSQGTLFYLYTPFTGALLRDVLDMLKQEAGQRPIRVVTLGPCTNIVAEERWLQTADTLTPAKIAMFHSV